MLAQRHRRAIGNRFELALLREALGEPDYEPDPASLSLLIRHVRPATSCLRSNNLH